MRRRFNLGFRGRWMLGTAIPLCLGSALLVFAYNPIQVVQTSGSLPLIAHWPTGAVKWSLNPSDPAGNVTNTGETIQQSLTGAFGIWSSSQALYGGQQFNAVTITQGPDSTVQFPNAQDCTNVVGFNDTNTADFSTGTIAFAQVSIKVVQPGASDPCGVINSTSASVSYIYDADIVFNPKDSFGTDGGVSPPAFDLRAIASHEFGHFLGLDHSGIMHSMMFPFADTIGSQQLKLFVDDILGIGFLYPNNPTFSQSTGMIQGQVTLSSGGAYAAHVLVIDAGSGDVVVDRLTGSDGTYSIAGVPPGQYKVLVVPLAPDVKSGLFTLGNFSGWACGYNQNAPPCCDPSQATCTGSLTNPTNYTGKFF